MREAPLLATGAGAASGSDELKRVQRLRALGAIVLTALPFLLLWPTTESLMLRWQDTVTRTYTHGLPIIALSMWMIWRGRARWMSVPAQVFLPGAGLLLAASLVWLIAYRSGLQIVHQGLLPLFAFAALLTCFGWPLARRMSLPVAYLYFAIPVWDAINPILQWTSVLAVRLMLRVAGIPAYFVGDTFHIPAGSFEIASGCSGLHFFIVAAAIAVLYGELNRDRLRTRVLLVALALGLAMATNWVRVFIIVLAGHLTDMQHYLVSGEHYSFGWFMFAGVMVLYFLIVRRWPMAPSEDVQQTGLASQRAVPLLGFALAVLALVPAAASNLFDTNRAASLAQALPRNVPGWSASASAPASVRDWQPQFKGADLEEQVAYSSSSGVLDAYAATYAEQRQGKEVIGYENSVLGAGFDRESADRATVGAWKEARATGVDGATWLFWYAYRLDERWYSRPLDLQLAYGSSSLLGAPVTSAIVIRARCTSDCDAARRVLNEFTAAAWPRG